MKDKFELVWAVVAEDQAGQIIHLFKTKEQAEEFIEIAKKEFEV